MTAGWVWRIRCSATPHQSRTDGSAADGGPLRGKTGGAKTERGSACRFARKGEPCDTYMPMRYIGSKFSTIPELTKLITERVRGGTFCDCFGGVGTVGSHFKSLGFQVWTSDLLNFAYFFQIARIRRQRRPALRGVCAALRLRGSDDAFKALISQKSSRGWFVEEYARKRRFFTEENACAIQGCWRTIRRWSNEGWLSADEHAVLTASLINSMDRVANTAGTYYAYLKSWHRKALQSFRFELIAPTPGLPNCECMHGPAQKMVEQRRFDVLYVDPPYNDRRYDGYYHLPETLAKGTTPRVNGMAGKPKAVSERSTFNDARFASTALKVLVESARFRLLAFHYSDEGLIPRESVRAILREHGVVEEFCLTSRGYTTENAPRSVPHRLYLVHHA